MRGQKSRTVVLVFLLVCGFFSFLQFPIREVKASVSDGWYYADFGYRVEHNITISTTQTNYQVNITIVNGTGTSTSYIHYTTNVLQSDFDDVRFTWYNYTSQEEIPCSYWKESYNSSQNATFWIKIPEIPSSGVATIYVYYGSASATDASDGEATFEFFDNFLGTSLNTSKWSEAGSGSVSVSNSIVTVTSVDTANLKCIYSSDSFTGGYALRGRIKLGGTTTNYKSFGFAEGTAPQGLAKYRTDALRHKYTGSTFTATSGDGTNYQFPAYSISADTDWHITEAKRTGTSDKFQLDSDEITGNYPTNNNRFIQLLDGKSAQGISADWILVRKYVSPEPSHGSWGTEEQQTTGTAPSVEAVGRTTNEKGKSCTFYAKWNSGSGSLSHWRFRWNGSGSWEWYPSTGYYSFTSSWSNITLTLPSTENVVVEWFIEANNTDGLWGNTTIQRLLVVKELMQTMEENFGKDARTSSWGHGIYVNGTVEAIYVVYSNTSFTPWKYQIKAFNLNNYTWTDAFDFGDSDSSDVHWCPSVGLLPNGSLIVFKGYYAPIQFKVTKNSALTETNLTKLLTEWGNWSTVPYEGFIDDHSYPYPLTVNDTLLLFGRIGSSSHGNFSLWRWNSTIGNFSNPTALIESWTGYPYPSITERDGKILIVWSGNETYSSTYYYNNRRSVWFAYSNDTGETWYSVNGTQLTLPIAWNETKCFVTDTERLRTTAVQINEHGTLQLAWLVWKHYPHYEVPSYLQGAMWNGTLGSSGEWVTFNITDMNGNVLENCSLNGLLFDNYYNRTSFWSGEASYMRKYVFYNESCVDYVYSDKENGLYAVSSDSCIVEDGSEAFEIIIREITEIIGHGQFEFNATDTMNVNEDYIVACKFTAEETGYVTTVQFKTDTVGVDGQDIRFRAAIYNSSLHRIGYGTSDTRVMTRAEEFVGWSIKASLTYPAYIEKGNEYYIAINFYDVGTQDYIKFFYQTGTTNQTFTYYYTGNDFPETLSPQNNYTRELLAVGYATNTKVRGCGLIIVLDKTTNSTTPNDTCLFSVKWKAYSGTLDTAILYTNTTGTMQQRGTYTFPAGQSIAWANITDTLPSGGTLAWYMIANNTAGVWGNTTVQYLELGIYETYTINENPVFSSLEINSLIHIHVEYLSIADILSRHVTAVMPLTEQLLFSPNIFNIISGTQTAQVSFTTAETETLTVLETQQVSFLSLLSGWINTWLTNTLTTRDATYKTGTHIETEYMSLADMLYTFSSLILTETDTLTLQDTQTGTVIITQTEHISILETLANILSGCWQEHFTLSDASSTSTASLQEREVVDSVTVTDSQTGTLVKVTVEHVSLADILAQLLTAIAPQPIQIIEFPAGTVMVTRTEHVSLADAVWKALAALHAETVTETWSFSDTVVTVQTYTPVPVTVGRGLAIVALAIGLAALAIALQRRERET